MADCAGMTMPAFRRFNPYAILAMADRERQTLAASAGLADAAVEIENEPEAPVINDPDSADSSPNHDGTPAKVANPAKVDVGQPGALANLAALALQGSETETATVEQGGQIIAPVRW